MRMRITTLLMPWLAGAAIVAAAGAARQEAGQPGDLAGRWRLNPELSQQATPEVPEMGSPRDPGSRRSPRGGTPPTGGGMRGGRAGAGSAERRPANINDMAKMRDAVRVLMHAPTELIVTRPDVEEVVFTAMDSGEIIRVLVAGRKVKTTAGGVEHEVTATWKDRALITERTLGTLKIVDTYRVAADGRQLERTTKLEGGPGGKTGRELLRRVYERLDGPE